MDVVLGQSPRAYEGLNAVLSLVCIAVIGMSKWAAKSDSVNGSNGFVLCVYRLHVCVCLKKKNSNYLVISFI